MTSRMAFVSSKQPLLDRRVLHQAQGQASPNFTHSDDRVGHAGVHAGAQRASREGGLRVDDLLVAARFPYVGIGVVPAPRARADEVRPALSTRATTLLSRSLLRAAYRFSQRSRRESANLHPNNVFWPVLAPPSTPDEPVKMVPFCPD